MFQALYSLPDRPLRKIKTVEEIRELHASGEGMLWVNLYACQQTEYDTFLREMFHFHPLAIEDTLSTGYQPPKVDDFGDHLFIIVHAIAVGEDVSRLSTDELNCFLGRNFVVTTSHVRLAALDTIWDRAVRDGRILERGSDFLAHAVLDAIVDEFLPYLDRIDEEVDFLEDSIIQDPKPSALRRILELKHSILALRRVVSPQREVMQRLSRGEFDLISRNCEIYFRDIYDHLVRITDLSEGVRDVVGSTLDTYLSVSSNKMNEIMKALTIVSTIFLPLTLVTSLYGMNFDLMPELRWRYGYLMVWAIMLAIIVGMLWFFRRRRWL